MNIDDVYDGRKVSELIAEGEYKSSKEEILRGFKIFQKKYVYKSVAVQMTLVVLAIITQLVNIVMGADRDVSFSWMLVVFCVVLGGYLLMRPKNVYRKLDSSLGELEGAVYKAEIYTDSLKILTIHDTYISEEAEKEAEAEESEAEGEEDDTPPATIIHLDNGSVEITDCSDMYIVYVKKINVFVIPKSAFTPEENTEIKNRLSNIMGVRYKEN